MRHTLRRLTATVACAAVALIAAPGVAAADDGGGLLFVGDTDPATGLTVREWYPEGEDCDDAPAHPKLDAHVVVTEDTTVEDPSDPNGEAVLPLREGTVLRSGSAPCAGNGESLWPAKIPGVKPIAWISETEVEPVPVPSKIKTKVKVRVGVPGTLQIGDFGAVHERPDSLSPIIGQLDPGTHVRAGQPVHGMIQLHDMLTGPPIYTPIRWKAKDKSHFGYIRSTELIHGPREGKALWGGQPTLTVTVTALGDDLPIVQPTAPIDPDDVTMPATNFGTQVGTVHEGDRVVVSKRMWEQKAYGTISTIISEAQIASLPKSVRYLGHEWRLIEVPSGGYLGWVPAFLGVPPDGPTGTALATVTVTPSSGGAPAGDSRWETDDPDTSSAPAPVTVTVTQPPTTTAPTPGVEGAGPPTESPSAAPTVEDAPGQGSGSSLGWLWGVLVLIAAGGGVGVMIAMLRRRRATPAEPEGPAEPDADSAEPETPDDDGEQDGPDNA